MKRARRIIYNMVTVVSLLLCLGTVGVWVRSYWVDDRLMWSDWPEDRAYLDQKGIWSARGGIQFVDTYYLWANGRSPFDLDFWHDRQPATKYPMFGNGGPSFLQPAPPRYAALGFEWIPETTSRWASTTYFSVRIKSFTFPLYFPTLLFALLPAHYLLRVRRRRRIAQRQAQGCCIACGYDLRGSPARCPECGAAGATPGAK